MIKKKYLIYKKNNPYLAWLLYYIVTQKCLPKINKITTNMNIDTQWVPKNVNITDTIFLPATTLYWDALYIRTKDYQLSVQFQYFSPPHSQYFLGLPKLKSKCMFQIKWNGHSAYTHQSRKSDKIRKVMARSLLYFL